MSARAYFGTDGIRGQANRHPMTAEVALRVGLAAGKLFRSGGDRRHLVVIGKDTRLSGYMIEPALVAGFTSVGMDVRTFGPAADARRGDDDALDARRPGRDDLGFAQQLRRQRHQAVRPRRLQAVRRDARLKIEALMDEGLRKAWPSPAELGRVVRIDDAQARYIEIVKADLPAPAQPERPARGDRLRQRRRLQGRADRALRAGRRGEGGRRHRPTA